MGRSVNTVVDPYGKPWAACAWFTSSVFILFFSDFEKRFLSQNVWWLSETRKHVNNPDELLNGSGCWQGAGENWSLVDYFLTVCWHGVRRTSLQLVVHQQHSVSSRSAPTNGTSCFLWQTGMAREEETAACAFLKSSDSFNSKCLEWQNKKDKGPW